MADSECRVFFKGEIQDGHSLDEVKSRMAKKFKMDAGKIEHFFSGKTVTIKKCLNQETAEKYKQAIHKAGGRCWISSGDSQSKPEPKASDFSEFDQQANSEFNQKDSVQESVDLPLQQTKAYPAVISDMKDQMISDHIGQAKVLGRNSFGQTLEVSGNAFHALKILLTDPLKWHSQSIPYLEKSKGIYAGIVFICFFMAAAFLVERTHFSSLNEMSFMLGGGMLIGPNDHIKMLLLNFVPPMALCLSFYVINKMAGEFEGSFHAYTYTGGAVLIPSGITLLVLWIFGYGNIEFVGLVAFFGMSITILMIKDFLQEIYSISPGKAVLLTPIVVLVTIYVSKLLFIALIQRF